jgi:hypothetical protein
MAQECPTGICRYAGYNCVVRSLYSTSIQFFRSKVEITLYAVECSKAIVTVVIQVEKNVFYKIHCCSDKKENQIFLIYKDIRMEQWQSHIWGIFAHFLIYFEALPHI